MSNHIHCVTENGNPACQRCAELLEKGAWLRTHLTDLEAENGRLKEELADTWKLKSEVLGWMQKCAAAEKERDEANERVRLLGRAISETACDHCKTVHERLAPSCCDKYEYSLRASEEKAEKMTLHIAERIAQITAHRGCCGSEHDPSAGKLHGYCVVCGIPWPCAYVGEPPTPAPVPKPSETVVLDQTIPPEVMRTLDELREARERSARSDLIIGGGASPSETAGEGGKKV